jgi:ribosomal protein L37E
VRGIPPMRANRSSKCECRVCGSRHGKWPTRMCSTCEYDEWRLTNANYVPSFRKGKRRADLDPDREPLVLETEE